MMIIMMIMMRPRNSKNKPLKTNMDIII